MGWGRKKEQICRSKEVKSRNRKERKSILFRSKEGERRMGKTGRAYYVGVNRGKVRMRMKEYVGEKRGKL